MKNLILTILMTSTLLGLNAKATTQEITTMSQILSYLDDQTLLVFDLDNTVLEPVQTLGSDQWFKSLIASGNTVPQAIALWEPVQNQTRMQAVEKITPEIILDAQRRGLSVMALTARPSDLAQTTEKQLDTIGVSFLKSPPFPFDILDTSKDSAQYINGIEYVGPLLSKGAALIQFLNRTGLKPKKIVFVDDTLKHSQTVNASLDQAGIENFEFRYGGADPRVRAYNPSVANVELQIFQKCNGELISDSVALEMSSSGLLRCP